MPKNHISNLYTENTEILESKNRKSSYQNRNIEFGIIEAEIRIEAKQLSKKIVTALPARQEDALDDRWCLHSWRATGKLFQASDAWLVSW